MKDIHQKLLATFQIEHRDHVEQIRSLLASIAQTSGQPGGPELEEVFRRAHSLKGAARAVDLRPIEGLAHRMETLFSRVRQGTLTLDRDVSAVVSQVLDATEDCIVALAENRPSATFAAAFQAIERVLGMKTETFAEGPQEIHSTVPTFQPVETVRITAQNFEGLFRSAGRVLAESQRQDVVEDKLNRLVCDIALIANESERVRKSVSAALRRPDARGEIARLTTSLDSIDRQMRAVSRHAGVVRRLHQSSSWNMRQLGKELQRDVWQARMVPAESLLEGFRKMVRDLARDEGKEIEFRSTSAGVHADRRVLEALKDPIMHLLRNAVSHGVEPPSEREGKGKPPFGLLTLRVDTNGQRLTIVVEDDGRGVDLGRVAQVAVRDGLLSESAAPRASAQELTRILFRPGFSTCKTVTNLSGRGMGLSVVYEAVRRLQGDLDIQPAGGGGTTITVSVPLSIATHRLLLATCGKHVFAIPIHGIECLRRIKLASIETTEGKPVVVLKNQPVVLASLPGLLGFGDSVTQTDSNILRVVVLRSGTQRLAVGVDGFLRETDAVIQDLGPAAGCGGKVSAGVVLEDGGIAFLVNPMELIQSSLQARPDSRAVPFVKTAEPVPDAKPSSILVVDDSLTTRALEKSILEAHGYQVRVAVDGVEALAQLRQEKADLVIADIEMPRLNGFGLIEAMKKDRELERIPVIIVSSVERREDQERGLGLGADAYIVKRKFDQGELLGVIRQIL